MPAAANLSNLSPKAGEAVPGAPATAAELFAALVAGVAPRASAPTEPVDGPKPEPVFDPVEPEDGSAVMDASLLLPLLEQQRAIIPAAAPPPEGTPAPVAIKAEAAAPQAALSMPNTPAVQAIEGAGPGLTEAAPPPAAQVDQPVSEAGPIVSRTAAKASDTTSPAKPIAHEPVEVQGDTAPAAAPKPQSPALELQVSSAKTVPAINLAAAPLGGTPFPVAEAKVPPQVPSSSPAEATTRHAPGRDQASAVAQAAAPAIRSEPKASSAKAATKASPDLIPEHAAPEASAPQVASERPVLPPLPTFHVGPAASALQQPAAAAPAVGAAIAEQVLDMSRGNAWIDELARDISRTASAEGSMRFRLAPETLGELRVEITHSDKGAHVRLQVSSETAQQALADAQPKLAAEARVQGVRIAETEVSLAGGQSDGREASRQGPQSQPDQPLRAFRSSAAGSPTHSQAGEPDGRRRQDRYA